MIDFFSTIDVASSPVINTLIQAFVFEIVIFMLIPFVGALIESVIVKGVRFVIAIVVGGEFEFVLSNYILFPGTMIHELSHAIFALVTGAKVTEVALFEPDGGSLGHVSFYARGNAFFRGLQNSLSACAPVVVGLTLCYFAITRFFPAFSALWHWILGIYLLVAMVFHMNMSTPDLKLYFKGALSLLAIGFPICILLFVYA